MSEIDWDIVKNFNPNIDNFSEDPDLHAEPQLIYDLDHYRNLLGVPVYVSPVPGALARFKGSTTSRHFALQRKSDAIDIFPSGDIRRAWMIAVSCGLWGGVGLYPYTNFKGRNWPMLHLDKRPADNGVMMWIRKENDDYVYPLSDDLALETLFNELSV